MNISNEPDVLQKIEEDKEEEQKMNEQFSQIELKNKRLIRKDKLSPQE